MVLGCTVFAAAAQVLLKFGAMPQMNPADPSTWKSFAVALLGNYQLVLGYCAHSGNALLLILALRDGELSMLYPIIALTYVGVNLFSMRWRGASGASEFTHVSKTRSVPLSSYSWRP